MAAYEEMMRTCPNDAMYAECVRFMRNQKMKHIVHKWKINKPSEPNSTILFGENPTNRKKITRHKSVGEKVLQKKP